MRKARCAAILAVCGFAVHAGLFLGRILQAHSFRPYRFAAAFEARLQGCGDEEHARRIEEALAGYRQAVSWDPRDPKNRIESARLCLRLSSLRKDEAAVLLAEAGSSLETTLREMPASGDAWFLLAQTRRAQGHGAEADRAMAAAQRLAPSEPALAKDMAAHWIERRAACPEHILLSLLADRLLLLNRVKFGRYGVSSLRIWSALSGDSPWGAVLPRDERCALAAARFYLEDEIHRDEDRAEEMLGHVSSPKFLPEKHWILAERSLRRGGARAAAESYMQGVLSADPGEQETLARKAATALLDAGLPDEAMRLLEATGQSTAENRVALGERALAAGFHREILPFLEIAPQLPDAGARVETAETYGSEPLPSRARESTAAEHFLLSRCREKAGDLARAVACAEKAATRAPETESYALHYCRLLLSANMENSAALYFASYGSRMSRPGVFCDMLARRLASRKDWNGARDWAEKAVEKEPENEDFRKNLSRIYLRQRE